METNALLEKNTALARQGDCGGFENFYILTVDDSYRKIIGFTPEEGEAESILADVYISLWKDFRTMPMIASDIRAAIDREIRHIAQKHLGAEAVEHPAAGEFAALSDDRAAAVWFRIARELGFFEEPGKTQSGFRAWLRTFVRIGAAVLVVAAALFLIWFFWKAL